MRRTLLPGLITLLALAVLLLGALPAVAQDEGESTITTQPGDPICVTCHGSVSNDVVTSWRSQNHGQARVGCPTCHNTHAEEFRPNPKADVCAGCHDIKAAHPDMGPETPGSRCMECHTANVHLMPGEESWFQGGLPREDLSGEQPPPAGQVPPATARVAAGVLLAFAIAAGLVMGWLFVRLTRKV